MTLNQAKKLQEGDLVAAILEDPTGGESRWSGHETRWVYEPVCAGQVVVFQRLIPKVRIVRSGPWKDGHDRMLFCKTRDGQRAWLNIGNGQKIQKNGTAGHAAKLGAEEEQ